MHGLASMVLIPFVVYLALVLIGWVAVGRFLPGFLLTLRRLGRKVAEEISSRGYTERWLSFLPERILALKPYAALILLVLAGSLVAFGAGDQFFDLAEALRTESPTMLRIDHAVHGWTNDNRYDFLTPFYLTLSILGNPLGLTLILLTGIAIALIRRQIDIALYLAMTCGVGGLLNLWLKRIFGRERPDLLLALSDAAHESFPSGHTMGSAIVLGALAYSALRLGVSWRWKSFWVSASLVTALLIAVSRIYLGVHWISDIAAGFAAGLAWLITSIVVFETLRQVRAWRRRVAPELHHGSE